MNTITKQNHYDTRAVVKITEWEGDKILTLLKQHTTVNGEWFTREVFIGGTLCTLLEFLQEEGKLKLETLKTFHYPSEKVRQVMKEKEEHTL